ncbi:MAG: hypothetical protein DDT40_01930 [candidate division WS2 bacterium]|nr:hypothetical protein [Candidatus Psychracetigena formicireducens]
MEWLMRNVFSDPARANYYRDRKLACYGGMETYLWDNIAQNYRKSACTPTGGTDWTVFYADATCQLFPIWNGVIPPESRRAEHLFSMFNTYHPGWPYLRTADPFPWAILCYSAAKMGDKYRVDTFLNNVRAKYIDAGHPWTWYNNEAGFTIRAARAMRDIYNLALNRIVSIPSDVPLCLASDVSNVNDGKLFTEWTMITANNDGAWIKIDLAASKQLNRVLIKWGADRALTYKVQLSDDGINFIDVYTVSSGKEGTDDVILDRVHMKKYIRLLFDELPTNKITIREVEIYYEPENLALGKTATASSNQSNTYKSIDGDTSTRWESSFIDFMPWYTVDLGSITDINKVIIDWEASYAAAYSVQTSMDGRRFTTVYSTLGGDGGVDTIRFPTIGARHIKVLCTRRVILSGISFWEVRVYNNIN